MCRCTVPLLVVIALGLTSHTPDTPERAKPVPDTPLSDGSPLPMPRDLDGRPITLSPNPDDDLDIITASESFDPATALFCLPELDRLAEKTIDSLVTTDNLGRPAGDVLRLPMFLTALRPDAPKEGDPPAKAKDAVKAFEGRNGPAKTKLIRDGGANEASERAVAMGLAWLAKQQKDDGGWEFDQGSKEERVAATGLALLPFLGAGQSHTDAGAKYQDTVKKGVDWLKKKADGPKAGRMTDNMYAQAIGTLALVEAYGLSLDPALKADAQAAVNYLQKCQGPNGSWGYAPATNGDTSIVGWQIQTLFAAKVAGLEVSDKAIGKATAFLNLAAGGTRKSMYGYADSAGARPGSALTAVGLLSRYNIDGWSPMHPGLVDGVAGLTKHPPAGKGELKDLYYLYYATQVVQKYDGEEWRNWNEGPKGADGVRKGGMRDWLVSAQVKKDGANPGSWDPEQGWFGSSCGRLGTTAVCVLNLEVYYRYPHLYKRGGGGAAKILEDK